MPKIIITWGSNRASEQTHRCNLTLLKLFFSFSSWGLWPHEQKHRTALAATTNCARARGRGFLGTRAGVMWAHYARARGNFRRFVVLWINRPFLTENGEYNFGALKPYFQPQNQMSGGFAPSGDLPALVWLVRRATSYVVCATWHVLHVRRTYHVTYVLRMYARASGFLHRLEVKYHFCTVRRVGVVEVVA